MDQRLNAIRAELDQRTSAMIEKPRRTRAKRVVVKPPEEDEQQQEIVEEKKVVVEKKPRGRPRSATKKK